MTLMVAKRRPSPADAIVVEVVDVRELDRLRPMLRDIVDVINELIRGHESLYEKAFGVEPHANAWSNKDVAGWLSDGHWLALAMDNGRCIGVAAMSRTPAPQEDLGLRNFSIRAKYQGKGVGTRMLAAIEELARELGLRAVQLGVLATNPRAVAMYEREGFIPVRMIMRKAV